jgi:hypothetical protein
MPFPDGGVAAMALSPLVPAAGPVFDSTNSALEFNKSKPKKSTSGCSQHAGETNIAWLLLAFFISLWPRYFKRLLTER